MSGRGFSSPLLISVYSTWWYKRQEDKHLFSQIPRVFAYINSWLQNYLWKFEPISQQWTTAWRTKSLAALEFFHFSISGNLFPSVASEGTPSSRWQITTVWCTFQTCIFFCKYFINSTRDRDGHGIFIHKNLLRNLT